MEQFNDTYNIDIYIAGDYNRLKLLCQEFCTTDPFCVSLQKTDFTYNFGMESGAKITIIKYPRFNNTPEVLRTKARALAEFLLDKTFQKSCSIIQPEQTIWITNE